jgi:predicted kinase
MTKILYIMCGVGFAGKSTLAKKIAEVLNAELVSQDAHYFELKAELPSWGEDPYEREEFRVMIKNRIRENLTTGRSVVFDNTNLTRKERDELRALAEGVGAETLVIFLDTPEAILDERQERNRVTKERHDVEQHYLDEAKMELEVPSPDENVYVFSPGMDVDTFIRQLSQ